MAPPRVGPRPSTAPPPPRADDQAPAKTAEAPTATAAAPGDGFDNRVELTQSHTLSAAELATLARTNPELAQSAREAQSSLKVLLAKGAKISITTSAGNGGKPVVTIIPPALAKPTSPPTPYAVNVHYHGMDGRASKPNPDSPLAARIAESFNQTPATVFVLPEWNKTNDWSNVKDTGATLIDATAGLVGRQGTVTVSAHSLGRRAIESAIAHQGLTAHRLDLQDAFYKSQPEGPRAVAAWRNAHPDAEVRILLTTHGAMSDQATIQKQADLPDRLFVDQGSEQNHWDAELKPW